MPAVGTVRTRTNKVAHAIDAARRAVEQHLHAANIVGDTEPLVQAHRALLHATELLGRTPKHVTRPADATPVAQAEHAIGPHDLTRIRGIDAKAVTGLTALGITRFEQIAAWEPEDVRTIGQALDLGRSFQNNGVIDQAKMLLAPRDAPPAAVGETVAGWSPRAPLHVYEQAQETVTPLTADDLAKVHAVLRVGPGKAGLSNLAKLVPVVARAVYIPIELIESADDAPWRPSPLMETATPVAAATAAPTQAPSAEPIHTDALEAPTETIAAIANQVAVVMPDADVRPNEKPLHLITLDRIAAIDAEITTLGSRPSEPTTQAPEELPAVRPADVQMPRASTPRIRLMAPPTEEADVIIKVKSGRPSALLQPMSESPLHPKRKVFLKEPLPNTPAEVSEAAVVIVKRRAKDRAAPDLEFYKQNAISTDGQTQNELAS